MPIVSVILPTRKRNHLLPRALESLFAQTFTDFEVILVDDNPPESRVALAPGLQPLLRHTRVRLIEHEQPRNAARARNRGLQAAAGDWITYLDDDDVYRPTKLEKQHQRAQETGLPLGLCGYLYILARRRRARQVTHRFIEKADLLLEALPGTVAIFHRRTEAVRFDESLEACEDAHFFFQLVKHFQVDRVFNVPEPLVEVYLQPDARVNVNAEGQWRASQAIDRDYACRCEASRRRVFLARAELQYCKLRRGNLARMCRLGLQLLRLRGMREARPLLNAFLYKIPLARRFIVS
jgi:glycosyltransferase involved in cell wall biosynthesis